MNIAYTVVRGGCLGLLCGLLLGGCGTADATLDGAQEFDAFRVYYAGNEVAELPLEASEGEDWKDDEESVRWSFYYGDCDPPSDGGCAPPLQIQNYSICRRWPAMFSGGFDSFAFRGARATWRRGRGLEIITGRTTVVVIGTRGRAVKAAARQLREVEQTDWLKPLPPPIPGALRGRLPCQTGEPN